MPIELGDSWFSAKAIKVARLGKEYRRVRQEETQKRNNPRMKILEKKQTDLEREGHRSRGKQPRANVKDMKRS